MKKRYERAGNEQIFRSMIKYYIKHGYHLITLRARLAKLENEKELVAIEW